MIAVPALSATPSPQAWHAELGPLVRLALPIVVVQIGIMGIGVVHTMMVGHVSASHLAAVALGNLFYITVCGLGWGTLMALDPVVSQAIGAGDREGAERGIQRGVVLAAILSALSVPALLPVEPLLGLLGQPADVVPLAAGYVRASIPGVFAFFWFIALRQSLQSMRRTAPIVISIVVANLVSALLAWILVFGKFGAPALGVTGAGVAASVARWCMALGLLVLGWRELRGSLLHWHRKAFAPVPILRMLWLGIPIGIQLQLEIGVFSLVGLLMGRIGTVPMAGHQVAINIASLTYMVPLGISAAAAVLVGQAVGADDDARARRAAAAAMVVGIGFMLLSGAGLSLAPAALARVYTADPGVVAMAATLLVLAAVFQVFDGAQVVAFGVLRGTGDTRVPMVANLVGYWVVGLPISLWLAFGLGRGAVGLWWGLVVGLAAVAAFVIARMALRLRHHVRRVDLETPGT